MTFCCPIHKPPGPSVITASALGYRPGDLNILVVFAIGSESRRVRCRHRRGLPDLASHRLAAPAQSPSNRCSVRDRPPETLFVSCSWRHLSRVLRFRGNVLLERKADLIPRDRAEDVRPQWDRDASPHAKWGGLTDWFYVLKFTLRRRRARSRWARRRRCWALLVATRFALTARASS